MLVAFLSYNNITNVPNWASFIVDNGNQEEVPGIPTYKCSKNIGCAGGWNLICGIS